MNGSEAAAAALAGLRTFGAEAGAVEVKRAQGQLPKSVVETLSAFANTPGGGTLLLGVSEEKGFPVVGVTDAAKLQHDLASAAREQLTPPLQPEMEIVHLEGRPAVVAFVPELDRDAKPCYVTVRGMTGGSYIRVGEGDRRLTSEEVQQLRADRGQPRFDHELIVEASLDDLDSEAMHGVLDRVRRANPRLFSDRPDESVLKMLGVVRAADDGRVHPTLAGLLALGSYPQQFFPQLCLTFVHYPTRSGAAPDGTRFLDNVRVDGSVPHLVREAMVAIQRNMSRRALISQEGRTDVWDYPPEALREAVVNALVHRDLSPGSRGTQVQIEMYPDRLRIMNPGGLYGAVDITRLGEEGVSSSRNALLLKLLEDVPVPGGTQTVVENRGSGIRTMRAALARAGMSPPEFLDKVTSFQVTMPNHTLFDEDTVRLLGLLGRDGLKDTQRTALALMLKGQLLDNAKYRAATGISDSRIATQELQDLVAREFAAQIGDRGGARYSLSEYAKSLMHGDGKAVRPSRRRQILNLLSLHQELTKAELSSMLNVNPKTAEHWLTKLKREGEIEPSEPGRGVKNTKYRLAEGSPRLGGGGSP